uniref:IKBKB interacting protein n=1 Tax=Pundamilia nyererei TaxID=303518 RepID=A0A3B4EVP0_9CICH
MPTELKQRRKTQAQKQSDEPSEGSNGKEETQKVKTEAGDKTGASKTSSGLDIRSVMCLLSLAACGALSWLVLQQNEKFSQIEEKYRSLHGKTSSLLGGQRGALKSQLEGLEQDVARLKEWATGLTEKRAQLQSSLTSLREAVGQIEARTSTITKDFTSKVSSVRTDVRRMDGLHSEVESLLTQVGELEDEAARVEHSMVKRIGDVLASSIDRVSNLRSASERNSQAIEQLRRRIPELASADEQISERLVELESGRARVIRTVTFASDLKPKVANIRRDFGAFEPQLSDLTLRIGRLAKDLMERQREIAELRQTLSNLTAVEGDLSVTSKQVNEIADITDIGEIHKPT